MGKQNNVKIIGTIMNPLKLSHTTCGTNIYSTVLEVKRNSGNIDKIPIELKESEWFNKNLKVGTKVMVEGEIRSYTFYGHLKIIIWAYKITELEEFEQDINMIEIVGYICIKPLFRITPLGKKICEVRIAVNRGVDKNSYIPCVLWGLNAEYASYLNVGAKINIEGRIQSRDYNKTIDGCVVQKTAFEVSCDSIELV